MTLKRAISFLKKWELRYKRDGILTAGIICLKWDGMDMELTQIEAKATGGKVMQCLKTEQQNNKINTNGFQIECCDLNI